MTQQVNLLNPALIRPRDWVSLENLAIVNVLSLVLMYLLYQWTQSELDALQLKRNTAVTQYEAAQVALVTTKNKQNKQNNVLEQEQELQTLTKKLDMQNALVASFKYLQADNGHHILDVMQGFAQQSKAGVWLTGFKINAFEKSLTFSGRALQADAVPAYLEQLGKAEVFKGQLFSGLKMQTETLFESATADKPSKANAPSVPPPVSATPTVVAGTAPTELNSKPAEATANGAATPPARGVNPAPVPVKPVVKSLSVIEFEVKGYVHETGDSLPAGNSPDSEGGARG